MSVTHRLGSFSSRSASSRSTRISRSISSSSSAVGMSREMLHAGGGQSRMSIAGQSWGRAPSVYGGAGGFGTRISESVFSSGSMNSYGATAVINNEKLTMQNLNDRLATYLDKVRSLETANSKLELQIRVFFEKKSPSVSKDFTGYFATITQLRAQMMQGYLDNQRVILQVDNAQLALDDFKQKYEMELNLRTMAENDVFRFKEIRDGLTLTVSDLEMQIEGLREELVFMKTTQQEELHHLRIKQDGNINVEVDAGKSSDLALVLQEMREQYEAVVVKNQKELEKWFQSKVDTLKMQISTSSQEVTTVSTELSELKRTYQNLEISHQSISTSFQCFKQNMEEVNGRYSVQLSQLQLNINTMETDLQQLRVSMEQQQTEYKLLLDIKMRLEMEIAEYRRLLEGELHERQLNMNTYEETKSMVITKVVKEEKVEKVEKVVVEERKPHIERRVKVITEKIVDGKVVSSEVDVQMEAIQ